MHSLTASNMRMMTRIGSAVLCLGLLLSLAVIVNANDSKRNIPLYDGKPGQRIGDERVNPKDGAVMVWVPAGEFLMGTDEENSDRSPQRKVYLDGYWIYKYPVTVAQYREFCEATGRDMPTMFGLTWIDDHPMAMLTWHDADDYAKWAGMSLPTEAQWEKAARGTDGRVFPWGEEWDSGKSVNGVHRYLITTEPVGSYPSGASPYGAMDMSGNVWEWCADWYDPDYYKDSPSKNPTGPSGPAKYDPGFLRRQGTRVLRGGSFGHGSGSGSDPYTPVSNYYFECSARHSGIPDSRSYTYGFRCAETP